MPNTPNRGWTYPAKGTKPYFAEIASFYDEVDADVQALYDSGADVRYTNTEPTSVTIGGISAGSTFTDQTMTEMWDALLYPYQSPLFDSFSISGQSSVLEVGGEIPVSVTFIWSTSNPSNIVADSIDIEDVTLSSTLVSGTTNDGTEAVTMAGAISKTSATTHTFRISGENTESDTFSRDAVYQWRWRFYWGNSPNPSLVEADIEALSDNSLYSSIARTYSFDAAASNYKYICYPSLYGTLSNFKDTSTNLDIPFESPDTVSVTNANGQTTNYYVYRSTNQLGGAVDIQVS